MKQKIPENFECLCGKIYGSRTTLWRHKKICNTNDDIFGEEKTKLTDDSLVKMLINLYKELKDENKELHRPKRKMRQKPIKKIENFF
jgi:hypothetical protein